MHKIRYFHLGVVTEIGYHRLGEVTSEEKNGNCGGVVRPELDKQFGPAPTRNEPSPSGESQACSASIMSVPSRSAYCGGRMPREEAQTQSSGDRSDA